MIEDSLHLACACRPGTFGAGGYLAGSQRVIFFFPGLSAKPLAAVSQSCPYTWVGSWGQGLSDLWKSHLGLSFPC